MNLFAYIALLGWPFVAFFMFMVLPPRLAVLAGVVPGFLFLPEAQIVLAGLPEFTKFTAIALGTFSGAVVFDLARIRSFRPGWLDLPMALWCFLVPVATSLSNDLGWYDGFATTFDRLIHWGLPFLLGRIYFRDPASLRLLAKAVIIAGLLYLPLCLWEIRMSPQLHAMFYGFYQRPFLYVMRYGGYRPIVFLQSGLAVGMLMAAATVLSYWMFRSGAVRVLWGVPLWLCSVALAVTVVLGKTSAAITLMVVGVALYTAFRLPVARLVLVAMLLVVTAYPPLRIAGVLSGERILAVASAIYPPERVESLGVRLKSEDLMTEKAMRRPAFGWGGYGRSEVNDDRGRRIAIPDGLWFIVLGQNGLVGLFSLMAIYLLPPALLLRRHPPREWTRRAVAPVAAFSVVLILYWVDSLANAMLNAILVLSIGGLTGYHAQPARSRAPARQKASAGERSVARA